MTAVISRRNIFVSSGIVLALIVIGVIIWGYLTLASNYISLDVNPSIEIQTNRLNQVVSINPVNEDAKQIMAGYQLTDKNIEVVIKDIVDRMILNGYLAPNKDNQILITASKKNATAKLEKDVINIISIYLGEKQLNADLLQQNIDVEADTIEAARENSISAGKMALIQKLVQSDPSLTVEELSKDRISDLIALARTKNISLDGLIDENIDSNIDEQDDNNKDETGIGDEQDDSNKDETGIGDEQDDSNKDETGISDEQDDSNKDETGIGDEQDDNNNMDKSDAIDD